MSIPANPDWFFVYAVESPSAPDLYHARSERDVLSQALRLANVACISHCSISREAFCAALDFGLKDAIAQQQSRLPLLHISSHGHVDGIQLSSGDLIAWSELSELLSPINAALKGKLLVSMSCCEGYSGVRMAMRLGDTDLPYYALVGSAQKPFWSQTAIGFAVFYYRLSQGDHVNSAIAAMNVACGCNLFSVEWAENSKKFYAEYIRSYDPAQAQQQLTAAATVRQAHELQKHGLTVLPKLRRAA